MLSKTCREDHDMCADSCCYKVESAAEYSVEDNRNLMMELDINMKNQESGNEHILSIKTNTRQILVFFVHK